MSKFTLNGVDVELSQDGVLVFTFAGMTAVVHEDSDDVFEMVSRLVGRSDAEQPLPRSAGGDVWLEVISQAGGMSLSDAAIALMRERREFGIAKYGTPLQRENGRNHTKDAIDEVLDSIVYLWAAERRFQAVGQMRLLQELVGKHGA